MVWNPPTRLRVTRRWRRCFRQHGLRRACLCPRRPRRILQSISGSPTRASGTRAVRRPRSGRRRIPVLAAVAFCAMTGGAYAAGVTGAGSSTVSAVLDHIGVGSLVGGPSGDRTAATPRPLSRGRHRRRQPRGRPRTPPWAPSHRASHDDSDAGADGKGNGKGHGSDISKLAHTTDAKGVDKGAEISTAASGGKSHAGEHGNGHGGSHPSHPDHPIASQPSVAPGSPRRRQRRRRLAQARQLTSSPLRARWRTPCAPWPGRRAPSGTRARCTGGWPRGTAGPAPSG